jgi:hypothetical protein
VLQGRLGSSETIASEDCNEQIPLPDQRSQGRSRLRHLEALRPNQQCTLDARRFGKRTYITAQSIEAFVASLKPVVTPTLAKAEHDRWSGRGGPRPQEDEPGIA